MYTCIIQMIMGFVHTCMHSVCIQGCGVYNTSTRKGKQNNQYNNILVYIVQTTMLDIKLIKTTALTPLASSSHLASLYNNCTCGFSCATFSHWLHHKLPRIC